MTLVMLAGYSSIRALKLRGVMNRQAFQYNCYEQAITRLDDLDGILSVMEIYHRRGNGDACT
jgi:hypothetical protein